MGVAGGRDARRSDLAGLASSSVTRVTLGDVPTGWQQDQSLGAVGDRWLVIEVKTEQAGDSQISASWHAALVAGAFRDRAHASGFRDVLGYSTVLLYPDGTSRKSESLLTGSFEHSVDGRSAAAMAQAIRARLESAARQMGGVRRAKVSFRRPLAFAPILEVEAVDVQKASACVARHNLFGEVEGPLLQLNTAAGETIVVSAGSTRARSGKLWIRRGYLP